MSNRSHSKYCILICADAEWQVLRGLYRNTPVSSCQGGEYLVARVSIHGEHEAVTFFHTGWGKIAAAAGAQYAIDRWAPSLLLNLGTCGGLPGAIQRESFLLVNRTIVGDIVDLIDDQANSLLSYATDIDLGWLGESFPQQVVQGAILSNDRDLSPSDLQQLHTKYGAVAADWESGAIAYVCHKNKMRCLILRGVSDLVGEAYEGRGAIYTTGARVIITEMINQLPAWLSLITAQLEKSGARKAAAGGSTSA